MNFVRISYCHRQRHNFIFSGSTLLTLRRHVRECAALAPGNNILEAQSSRAACEIWVHLVRVPLGARSSNRNLVHLSKYSLILCLNIAFWKMNPLCQTPSSNSHQVPRSDFYQLFFETLSSCALCMWNLNSFYPKPSFLRPQTMIVLSFDKGRNVMLKKWWLSNNRWYVDNNLFERSFKLMPENFSDFVLDSVQLTS